ncbi:caspase family protein [Dictyobacter arantiisoli]|uniref:Peptidase C14 caspase domain-containing protein n=1 Tax=Dictyobacter arantiisoli TaxID=2014874 RepID=A0A5A5T8I3_9CHLR|nr:caspase family protein [Dictyobacter arantiisoli]GCF07722.1 hypothetical protein KDI_12860 [Dictyobacter arantiisoli]
MTASLRATVVGLNEYSDRRTKDAWLKFARADAEAIGQLLASSSAFQVERVDVLLDGQANEFAVQESLNSTFFSRRQMSNTVALFYFAGHGTPHPLDDRILLCCHDVDPANPNHGGIRLNDIYDLLHRSGADCNIAIIDACFSGDIINVQDMKRVYHISPVEQAKKAIETLQGREDKTIAIFAACRSSEEARETKERGHGIYTDEILQGWRDGLAGDEQGVVSLLGLAHYLSQRFARDRQVPQFTIRGAGQIELQRGQPRSSEAVKEKIEPLKPGTKLTNVYGEIHLPTFIPQQAAHISRQQLIIGSVALLVALLLCSIATATVPVLGGFFFGAFALWGIIAPILLIAVTRWSIPVFVVQLALLGGYGFDHFQWRIPVMNPALAFLASFEPIYWLLLLLETAMIVFMAFYLSTR